MLYFKPFDKLLKLFKKPLSILFPFLSLCVTAQNCLAVSSGSDSCTTMNETRGKNTSIATLLSKITLDSQHRFGAIQFETFRFLIKYYFVSATLKYVFTNYVVRSNKT